MISVASKPTLRRPELLLPLLDADELPDLLEDMFIFDGLFKALCRLSTANVVLTLPMPGVSDLFGHSTVTRHRRIFNGNEPLQIRAVSEVTMGSISSLGNRPREHRNEPCKDASWD
jgi:hypothetical protein